MINKIASTTSVSYNYRIVICASTIEFLFHVFIKEEYTSLDFKKHTFLSFFDITTGGDNTIAKELRHKTATYEHPSEN